MSSHDERLTQEPEELGADDLEPILDDAVEELTADDLEEWVDDDDSPVTITTEPVVGEEFDLQLTVNVPEMEKSAVVDAVRGPLNRKVREIADQCRWRRVVATFTGDAIIPSAIKDCVAELFADAKPQSVTVQRGYPDEVVLTNELPDLEVKTLEIAGTDGAPSFVRIDISGDGLTAADLNNLLPPKIAELCTGASGRGYVFCIHDAPSPDHELFSRPLREAGASRVALSENGQEVVLFDRTLEDLVTMSPDGDRTAVVVKSGRDEATTLRAMHYALTNSGDALRDQHVSVELPGELSNDQAIDLLHDLATTAAPAGIELSDGTRVWPPLLRVATKGRRTALRFRDGVQPNLSATFARELRGVSIAGQDVDLDWPADAAIDEGVRTALIAAKPDSVVFTRGGQDGELVHPQVVTWREEGDRTICAIETSHGKPAHLIPILRRAFAERDLNSRKADVEIQGSGVVSRSMREAIVDSLEQSGAAAGRLIDQGETEYLFPPLLSFEEIGANDFRVVIRPGERTPDDVAAATQAELAAREFSAETTVRVADEAWIATFVDAGTGRVVLDTDQPVQVHPPLFAPIARDDAHIRIEATPGADQEVTARQLERELPKILDEMRNATDADVTLAWPGACDLRARVIDSLLETHPEVLRVDDGSRTRQVHPEIVRTPVVVLGRRETAEPPLLMLGIDIDDADAAVAGLTPHADEIATSRVLIVYRDGEDEVAAAADNAAVQAARTVLDAGAKAALQFRPGRGATPAHFEVVSSSVEALAVGSRMKDPRGAGRTA